MLSALLCSSNLKSPAIPQTDTKCSELGGGKGRLLEALILGRVSGCIWEKGELQFCRNGGGRVRAWQILNLVVAAPGSAQTPLLLCLRTGSSCFDVLEGPSSNWFWGVGAATHSNHWKPHKLKEILHMKSFLGCF